MCGREADQLESPEGVPMALPAEINRSQLETIGLRIRLRFLLLNSNGAE